MRPITQSQPHATYSIAQSQPHATYSGFIHGLLNKCVYLSRTTPNVERYAGPLEDHLRMNFLPTLTWQSAFNDVMRSLMSLPSRLGGMGVVKPVLEAHAQYKASLCYHPLDILVSESFPGVHLTSYGYHLHEKE